MAQTLGATLDKSKSLLYNNRKFYGNREMPRKASIRSGFQQVFLKVPSATQAGIDQYSPELLQGTRFESKKYEFFIKAGLEARNQAEANGAPRPMPNSRWQAGDRLPKSLILNITILDAIWGYQRLDGSTQTNALLYFVWLGLDGSTSGRSDYPLQVRLL